VISLPVIVSDVLAHSDSQRVLTEEDHSV
jgi:hypothetical protein